MTPRYQSLAASHLDRVAKPRMTIVQAARLVLTHLVASGATESEALDAFTHAVRARVARRGLDSIALVRGAL